MEGDCAQRLEAALLRTLRHNAATATPACRAPSAGYGIQFIHQPRKSWAAALERVHPPPKTLRVKLFDGQPYIYLPDLLEAEEDIAARLPC